jgi:hypothetical protein
MLMQVRSPARSAMVAIFLGATGFGQELANPATGPAEPRPAAAAAEFFPPDAFRRGFSVSPPMIAREIPLAQFGRLAPMQATPDAPFWTLIHWHGVESLSDVCRTVFSEREAVWRNPYQGLRIVLGDAGRPVVTLSIDTLAVYNHDPISYERMQVIRPHFLLSHDFYPDRDGVRRYSGAEERETTPDGSTFPDLETFADLRLGLTLRLAQAQDLRQEYRGDDPAKRRLHYNRNCFQFWFRVYCRNAAAPAHGRFFWLGYRAYDSEVPYGSPIPHERDQIESDGRATYAYRLSDLSVHGPDYDRKLTAFRAGAATAIHIDLRQAAQTAIRAIREEKKDFLDATDDLAGFTLAGFNIGWEPASPFRGAMEITDLSLRGTARPRAAVGP